MAIRVVRLGSRRAKGEGTRIGAVRRPPRGMAKNDFATRDFYDVWPPDLAPSDALVKQGLAAVDDRAWAAFVKKYRAEMKRPDAARHRSVLRELLADHGAEIAVASLVYETARFPLASSRFAIHPLHSAARRLTGSGRLFVS